MPGRRRLYVPRQRARTTSTRKPASRPTAGLLDYRTSGKSTFGAPLAESFRRSDGKASWTSTADRGEAADDPTAVYVPLEGSPQMTAVLARSLCRRPRAAHELPAGSLEVRKLAETHLLRGERSADVALYAVSGVNFLPAVRLAAQRAGAALFRRHVPGYQTIEAGWRPMGRGCSRSSSRPRTTAAALAERLPIRSTACC